MREIVERVDDGDRGVGGELLHGLRVSGEYCAGIPSEEGVGRMERVFGLPFPVAGAGTLRTFH